MVPHGLLPAASERLFLAADCATLQNVCLRLDTIKPFDGHHHSSVIALLFTPHLQQCCAIVFMHSIVTVFCVGSVLAGRELHGRAPELRERPRGLRGRH